MSRLPIEPPRRSVARKAALTGLALALVTASVTAGTWAAFSATTGNPGNTFAAGTVVLTDIDNGGSAMLALADARPGDTDTSCITVNYQGSLPATVRLYGTVTGSGLDAYLDLTVTRGSGAAGFDDCSGFTPVALVYSGELAAYPQTYDDGINDPEEWTNGESHQYQLTVTLQADSGARGLDATAEFTWEARNT